jgi:hypothetical protein
VQFNGVAVTAQQDIFEINVASTKVVELIDPPLAVDRSRRRAGGGAFDPVQAGATTSGSGGTRRPRFRARLAMPRSPARSRSTTPRRRPRARSSRTTRWNWNVRVPSTSTSRRTRASGSPRRPHDGRTRDHAGRLDHHVGLRRLPRNRLRPQGALGHGRLSQYQRPPQPTQVLDLAFLSAGRQPHRPATSPRRRRRIAAFAAQSLTTGALAATESADTAAFAANSTTTSDLAATEAQDTAAFGRTTGDLARRKRPTPPCRPRGHGSARRRGLRSLHRGGPRRRHPGRQRSRRTPRGLPAQTSRAHARRHHRRGRGRSPLR